MHMHAMRTHVLEPLAASVVGFFFGFFMFHVSDGPPDVLLRLPAALAAFWSGLGVTDAADLAYLYTDHDQVRGATVAAGLQDTASTAVAAWRAARTQARSLLSARARRVQMIADAPWLLRRSSTTSPATATPTGRLLPRLPRVPVALPPTAVATGGSPETAPGRSFGLASESQVQQVLVVFHAVGPVCSRVAAQSSGAMSMLARLALLVLTSTLRWRHLRRSSHF